MLHSHEKEGCMSKNKTGKPTMVKVTILLPEQWVKEIDKVATRKVTTRTQIIRSLIQNGPLPVL